MILVSGMFPTVINEITEGGLGKLCVWAQRCGLALPKSSPSVRFKHSSIGEADQDVPHVIQLAIPTLSLLNKIPFPLSYGSSTE